eukprot:GHVP01050975.1.p1 GENE.GHVP01050975.1~~GHVP01050975.1.p1  ORF type:complete len:356 (+),score=66.12 GHVP01050975.1:18-1085(+)
MPLESSIASKNVDLNILKNVFEKAEKDESASLTVGLVLGYLDQYLIENSISHSSSNSAKWRKIVVSWASELDRSTIGLPQQQPWRTFLKKLENEGKKQNDILEENETKIELSLSSQIKHLLSRWNHYTKLRKTSCQLLKYQESVIRKQVEERTALKILKIFRHMLSWKSFVVRLAFKPKYLRLPKITFTVDTRLLFETWKSRKAELDGFQKKADSFRSSNLLKKSMRLIDCTICIIWMRKAADICHRQNVKKKSILCWHDFTQQEKATKFSTDTKETFSIYFLCVLLLKKGAQSSPSITVAEVFEKLRVTADLDHTTYSALLMTDIPPYFEPRFLYIRENVEALAQRLRTVTSIT